MGAIPRIAASLIVAHPDDEIIFAGHLMLAHPDVEWTVHVLCGGDEEREGRFYACMVELLKRGVDISMTVISALPDSSSVPREEEWFDVAVDHICQSHENPDVVFTHNRRGDYGHPLHCVVNYAVTSIFDNVWEFCCPVRSGSGPSWEGTRFYTPTASRMEKGDILHIAYPDEVEAMRRDRPGLHRWMVLGEDETFTSTGTLPW